jgi:hypothetical protein
MNSVQNDACEVIVIGAGPYGLAIGSHLKGAKVDVRVFGQAMSFWRRNMPRGMKLRSPLGATSIGERTGRLSLQAFDQFRGVLSRKYPMPLEEFVQYGEWFQQHAIPDLDTRKVDQVAAASGGFQLSLDDGGTVFARRVVIAMGLGKQEFRPPEFNGLPPELVSHTCEHDSMARFRGMHVAVIGRGQSACESAALLQEAGADVDLICRGDVRWLGQKPKPQVTRKGEPWHEEPSGRERLRQYLSNMLMAPSAVGSFPLSWAAEVPGVVHHFPSELRRWLNARSLQAGVVTWLLPRFEGVRVNAGRTILGAQLDGSRVRLKLDNGSVAYDHVLLATGYAVNLAKLGVLANDLRDRIRCIGGWPELTRGFQSSVQRLHFVGASAVASFGPLMRFIAGTGYAARSVTEAAVADRPYPRMRASDARVAPVHITEAS